MKTKKLPYFFLLLFLAGVLSTCKKYPEGPTFSLRSAQARITGAWGVEIFLVNAIDSTSKLPRDTFNGNIPCLYSFCPCDQTEKDKTIGGTCISGTWGFKNGNKDAIEISLGGSGSAPYPFVRSDITEWEIIRLTNKEMWLRTNISNNEYFAKYKKIED